MEQENQSQIFLYEGSPITFAKGDDIMLNATEMANRFDKTPKDWLRTKQAKTFLHFLSSDR